MKQLEGPDKVKQDIAIETPWKQEYKFIGSIYVPKGVKLFALNTKTWDLTLVISKKEVMVSLKGAPVTTSKAFHNPDCIYIKVINRKNADRKAAIIIRRYLAESIVRLSKS